MNPDITTTLWVALGGGLGSVTRFAIGNAITRLAGSKVVWGTLAVNILGSFLLGYLGIPLLSDGSIKPGPDIRLLVALGVYGGSRPFPPSAWKRLSCCGMAR